MGLDGLSFAVDEGQICALIGPNGSGKTTFFNVVSRIYEPDGGTIVFAGQDLLRVPAHRITDLGVTRTFQNLALFGGLSVLENVMVGAHSRTRGGFLTSAFRLPPVPSEERRARAGVAELLELLELGDVADRPAAASRTARSSASSWRVLLPPARSSSCSTSRRAA